MKEGDMVLLSTKDLDTSSFTSRSCRTLAPKYIGPYKILKKISENSFRLRFPGHMTLHPVFHASQLCPYQKPSKKVKAFTGFVPSLKDVPIQEVQSRKVAQGTVLYLTKWENGAVHWVPARNLEYAHHLIMEWEDLQ